MLTLTSTPLKADACDKSHHQTFTKLVSYTNSQNLRVIWLVEGKDTCSGALAADEAVEVTVGASVASTSGALITDDAGRGALVSDDAGFASRWALISDDVDFDFNSTEGRRM